MAQTVTGLSEAIKKGERPQHVKIFQVSVDDFLEHFDEVFPMLAILLNEIDFNITTGDSDNSTQFVKNSLIKMLGAQAQMKQKDKNVLLTGILEIMEKLKDKPVKDASNPASIILSSCIDTLRMELLSTKKCLTALVPIINGVFQQKKN